MSDSKSSTSDPIAAACLELIARLCESGQLQAKHELTANDLDLTEIRRQLEAAKLESIAEFAAGAGHEINNPAATIAGRAALLLKSETDPERSRSLETIGGQAYRIRDMIGDAMTFARPPQPLPQQFDPVQEAQFVFATWSDRLAAKGIQSECHFESDLQIYADREQFRVVVATLLRNVMEIPQSPLQLRLSVSREDISPTHSVALSVEDSGPGLTPVERTHLFDPFYSGRAAGRGLGFGLTKCWRIVRLNHGKIEASVSELGGLALHTSWPIEPQDVTAI